MKFTEVKNIEGDVMVLNLDHVTAFIENIENATTEVIIMGGESVEIDIPYSNFKKLLLSKFGLPG